MYGLCPQCITYLIMLSCQVRDMLKKIQVRPRRTSNALWVIPKHAMVSKGVLPCTIEIERLFITISK